MERSEVGFLLKIVLITDDLTQRQLLVESLKRYILFEQIDAIISLDTGDCAKLLAHIKADPQADYFFIVDTTLNCAKESGISLAEKIRRYYPFSSIVFLAPHEKLALKVLAKHLTPLDYIIKNNDFEVILESLRKDLVYALSHLEDSNKISPDFFTFKVNNRYHRITTSDILFFESVSNQVNTVILHTKDEVFELKKSLKTLEEQRLPNFFRCHKSYLVNLSNIYEFDKRSGQIFFDEQRTLKCQVSHRKMRELTNILTKYH